VPSAERCGGNGGNGGNYEITRTLGEQFSKKRGEIGWSFGEFNGPDKQLPPAVVSCVPGGMSRGQRCLAVELCSCLTKEVTAYANQH
jgi:hypothetical protein